MGDRLTDIATQDATYDGTLLGRFEGERPPAADWFTQALEQEPERSHFDVDGAAIELLTWGAVGKPGLLFLHGNAAHADWWSFIAPHFADDYRCAAISWSGMGGSQWRDRYAIPTFAKEAMRAIEVAQLAASGARPVIVAHSFGGFPTLYLGSQHPDAIAGAILVDSAPPRAEGGPPPRLAQGRDAHNRYPTLAAALRRFRLMPEQDAAHLEVVDFIARGGLHEVPESEAARGGWTWRFDPRFWENFHRGSLAARPTVPMGVIYGADSQLFPDGRLETLLDLLADCRFVTRIEGAGHHIMVDKPLEMIAAIREGLPKLA
ncbi:alpha/beta hydrolase [Tsuneonella sp. YG55]|uniref:Alpha/beta hydrolase n=1 Tax=Tsuneonella litorea TaxID=2976475 RepID=A0A9X2W5A3_9SPHN|nr:alpha/beta hydrolase [Tsuneonella litorea]MCT2559871.1 alpha/beta hydrolase [Tsuneonella litorea]